MKIALVNPPWSFEGSVYFGCREPHFALELGYAKALVERRGHDVLLVDAQLGVTWRTGSRDADAPSGDSGGFGDDQVRAALQDFEPGATAITTAPSYLFWRCAPPELRVPMQTADAVRDVAGRLIVVGPHASTTPLATLEKLGADFAVAGECEDVIARLADTDREHWRDVGAIASRDGDPHARGMKNASDMADLPALAWPEAAVRRHAHHHHRFDRGGHGHGAEVETSRGCPFHCTFCAKDNFRDTFRKRPLSTVLAELDGLIAMGVRYVYFIDEIFVPDRALLEALVARDVAFGVQLRIDHWTAPMLALLGEAGCVSIEAGVESITAEGRSLLAKKCKLSTEELTERLITAKRHVAFVQANLLDATTDSKDEVVAWRARLAAHGVWANEPVPLFPYPGSPDYTRRFGACDDVAWERAHAHYLSEFTSWSDIQESAPRPLAELEARHG